MKASKVKKVLGVAALPAEKFRWQFDQKLFQFSSTSEVNPIQGIVGQESAIDSLKFGLETTAPGQNIFVRGLDGTGRMALIHRLLQENQPTCRKPLDRCFVHNFEQPDRPRLVSLPPGDGGKFRKRIDRFADYIRDDLRASLDSDTVSQKRKKLEQKFRKQIDGLIEPFEKALLEADLRLVSFQSGNTTKTAIFPVHEGQAISPDDYEKLQVEGQIEQQKIDEFQKRRETFGKQFEEITQRVQEIQRGQAEALIELVSKEAKRQLVHLAKTLKRDFKTDAAHQFIDSIINDTVESRLPHLDETASDFTSLFRVNLCLSRSENQPCPIVIENTPTVSRLLGNIDFPEQSPNAVRSDHMAIRAGSILRADGGYLILDAKDLLEETGSWKVLVRTLRTGRLEIVPHDWNQGFQGFSIKPEPIKIDVKIILIGDADIYYMLERNARDFGNLFKVLADFDAHIPRSVESAHQYASVLSRMVAEENLLHFSASAVAALVEHGARIASRGGKLSARFGRLADIAREAVYLARQDKQEVVDKEHVNRTIKRTKRRADLPSRRFAELIHQGTIRIRTEGAVVGQINGLAVMSAGPLTYGFPSRITATIGPGTAGVINIEREASLSGAIHTKGFYILGGLLRHLLRSDHPLAFDASIAFEQSYGGIDGDSASGAEMCCLLSALTQIPLRQDLAMTGAIDQKGNILAIGAVNEKIEGFYDVCQSSGMTGTQGVIIPKSNAGDLMLRSDIVTAAHEGQFQIYPIDRIEQALELVMGKPAGDQTPYPKDTLLGLAMRQARNYWQMVSGQTRKSANRTK